MTGADHVIAARLGGWRLAAIDLVLGDSPLPGYSHVWRGDDGRMRGEVHVGRGEDASALDLRCVHGAVVVVHAPSYDDGLPLLLRAIDFDPVVAHLAAPDCSATYRGGEAVAWT